MMATGMAPSAPPLTLEDFTSILCKMQSQFLSTRDIYRLLLSYELLGVQPAAEVIQQPKPGDWRIYMGSLRVRADGLDWALTENSRGHTCVKENHIKLALDEVKVLEVYYATTASTPVIERRAYWLLDAPASDLSGAGPARGKSSRPVFVHYLLRHVPPAAGAGGGPDSAAGSQRKRGMAAAFSTATAPRSSLFAAAGDSAATPSAHVVRGTPTPAADHPCLRACPHLAHVLRALTCQPPARSCLEGSGGVADAPAPAPTPGRILRRAAGVATDWLPECESNAAFAALLPLGDAESGEGVGADGRRAVVDPGGHGSGAAQGAASGGCLQYRPELPAAADLRVPSAGAATPERASLAPVLAACPSHLLLSAAASDVSASQLMLCLGSAAGHAPSAALTGIPAGTRAHWTVAVMTDATSPTDIGRSRAAAGAGCLVTSARVVASNVVTVAVPGLETLQQAVGVATLANGQTIHATVQLFAPAADAFMSVDGSLGLLGLPLACSADAEAEAGASRFAAVSEAVSVSLSLLPASPPGANTPSELSGSLRPRAPEVPLLPRKRRATTGAPDPGEPGALSDEEVGSSFGGRTSGSAVASSYSGLLRRRSTHDAASVLSDGSSTAALSVRRETASAYSSCGEGGAALRSRLEGVLRQFLGARRCRRTGGCARTPPELSDFVGVETARDNRLKAAGGRGVFGGGEEEFDATEDEEESDADSCSLSSYLDWSSVGEASDSEAEADEKEGRHRRPSAIQKPQAHMLLSSAETAADRGAGAARVAAPPSCSAAAEGGGNCSPSDSYCEGAAEGGAAAPASAQPTSLGQLEDASVRLLSHVMAQLHTLEQGDALSTPPLASGASSSRAGAQHGGAGSEGSASSTALLSGCGRRRKRGSATSVASGAASLSRATNAASSCRDSHRRRCRGQRPEPGEGGSARSAWRRFQRHALLSLFGLLPRGSAGVGEGSRALAHRPLSLCEIDDQTAAALAVVLGDPWELCLPAFDEETLVRRHLWEMMQAHAASRSAASARSPVPVELPAPIASPRVTSTHEGAAAAVRFRFGGLLPRCSSAPSSSAAMRHDGGPPGEVALPPAHRTRASERGMGGTLAGQATSAEAAGLDLPALAVPVPAEVSMSDTDRQVLADAFACLSLRDKCAVARALQRQGEQAFPAASASSSADSGGKSYRARAASGGDTPTSLSGSSGKQAGSMGSPRAAGARLSAGAAVPSPGGRAAGSRGFSSGPSTPTSSVAPPPLAGTRSELTPTNTAARDASLLSLPLPAEHAHSVAAALSLMSQDERRDCEAEAAVITANVRAWLVRRSYRQLRTAARTLQRALRRKRSEPSQEALGGSSAGTAAVARATHAALASGRDGSSGPAAAAAAAPSAPFLQRMQLDGVVEEEGGAEADAEEEEEEGGRGCDPGSLAAAAHHPGRAGLPSVADGLSAAASPGGDLARPPPPLAGDRARLVRVVHAAAVLQRCLVKWYHRERSPATVPPAEEGASPPARSPELL